MDRKDTVAKVQETAAALADKVRDTRIDERAAELAARARDKVREAELDARAAEVTAAARLKLAEGGAEAREATAKTLDTVGEWLGEGRVGEALGLRRRRRRISKPWSLVVVGAVAVGVAVGVVVFGRRQQSQQQVSGVDDWQSPVPQGNGGGVRPSPDVELPLDGRVREAIGSDPRTAGCPPLNVNVVDGTVFVRGTVGSDVDQEALRSVIAGVRGVTDVDLQVTVTA